MTLFEHMASERYEMKFFRIFAPQKSNHSYKKKNKRKKTIRGGDILLLLILCIYSFGCVHCVCVCLCVLSTILETAFFINRNWYENVCTINSIK